MIFHGKFHPSNSLFRYLFKVNNRYRIYLPRYCLNFDTFLSPQNLKTFLRGEQILCLTISDYQTEMCYGNSGRKSLLKLESTSQNSLEPTFLVKIIKNNDISDLLSDFQIIIRRLMVSVVDSNPIDISDK